MNSIVNYFDKEFVLTDIEKIKLKYSLDVLFTDISKLLILFVIFHIIGESKDFLYSVIALLSIRPFTGGLHFRTYISCFLFTSFFFLIVIILNKIISLDYYGICLMIFSCIVIFSFEPIIHKNLLRKINRFFLAGFFIINFRCNKKTSTFQSDDVFCILNRPTCISELA